MLDFGTFWDGLSILGKIYWIVAIPSTIIFLIMLVLTVLGKDTDKDLDHDFDHPSDFGSHILGFKSIVSFFSMFSWIGILGAKMSPTLLIVLSILGGLIMSVIVASILWLLSKMEYSGTMDFKNAIGAEGEVYLSIPAKKSGKGKVQVIVQGTLRTLDAMTDNDEIIKTKTPIEVIDILSDNILLVKKKF